MNKFNNGKSKTEYYIKFHTFALVYLFDFVFVCLFCWVCTQLSLHSLWFCCYKLLHQHSRHLNQSNPTSRGNGHLTNTFQHCGKSLWNNTIIAPLWWNSWYSLFHILVHNRSFLDISADFNLLKTLELLFLNLLISKNLQPTLVFLVEVLVENLRKWMGGNHFLNNAVQVEIIIF